MLASTVAGAATAVTVVSRGVLPMQATAVTPAKVAQALLVSLVLRERGP